MEQYKKESAESQIGMPPTKNSLGANIFAYN